MLGNSKKIIPKFQKKLQGFLSDESGKITKEDVLKIGMVAMWLAGGVAVDNANAVCTTTHTINTVTFGEATWTPTAMDRYYPGWASPLCTVPQSRLYGTIYTNVGMAPYSVTVNGHANSTATIQWGWLNGGTLTTDAAYTSHSNSGSGSGSGSGGGWC